MATRLRAPAMPWSRQRLAVVLGIAAVVALTVIAGLSIVLVRLALATDSLPVDSATAVAPAEADRRDQIAAEPMAAVSPEAAFAPDPALSPARPIAIPIATNGRGPAGVATGFPQTPEGAVGQLAAIEQTVLETMSLEITREVHDAWTLPGAPGYEEWELTDNVRSFLRSGQQGGQEMDATTVVVTAPAMAMVKGADGPDWVVACVLLDVQVSIRTDARMGYGHCSRMQWADGRWQIAPGSAPSRAPSAWPGSVTAVEAGWLTWQEAGS
ncbi:MAG: hypothetical protein KIT69_08575 [Propionibacteriaceae bacterium]|nr:hypothetical protein [Propionibacteriaceae bacterium]